MARVSSACCRVRGILREAVFGRNAGKTLLRERPARADDEVTIARPARGRNVPQEADDVDRTWTGAVRLTLHRLHQTRELSLGGLALVHGPYDLRRTDGRRTRRRLDDPSRWRAEPWTDRRPHVRWGSGRHHH